MVDASAPAKLDWLDALSSRPWGWPAAFLALSALLTCAMLAWWAVFGFWDTLFDPDEAFGISFDARNHFTMGVLLAFVATGTSWVRQGSLRDLRRLCESAGVPPGEISAMLRSESSSPGVVRALAFGAALLLAIVVIPLSAGAKLSSISGWDMHHVWGVATNVGLFFFISNSAWQTQKSWQNIGRLTKAHLSIDLLDRRTITSIGRHGSRGALLWLLGSTIGSTLTWGMTEIAPVLVIVTLVLGFAIATLVVPAWIARESLQQVKQAELERVRTKIAGARDLALSSDPAEAREQAMLLQGLLAYEARIDSVREWPYDTPTLLRFAALAAIALSSWLGGALVERALGAVLD